MKPEARFAISTAPKRNSLHWRVKDVSWDELLGWMAAPKNRKEAGNYLLGSLSETTVTHHGETEPCRGYHRAKLAVVSRSMLALDVDTPSPQFWDAVELLLPYAAILHTTYSSTIEEPRYRLLIPLNRDVSPDEYRAACEVLMEQLGVENFDPGTSQPERYMFRPAARTPEDFHWMELSGDPADADALLADWNPDLSTLPTPKPSQNKRDPRELAGVAGAFNRRYDIQECIEAYALPYEEAGAERWQLTGAGGAAGMSQVADGLVYSHHSNDPAFGETCSSFDLVRLHRFAHLDDGHESKPVNRRPSHEAMLQLASQDAEVIAEMVGQDFTAEMDAIVDGGGGDDGDDGDDDGDDGDHTPDPNSWKLRLSYNARTGKVNDVIGNWDLIVENYPVFAALRFNEFTMAIETEEAPPWRGLDRGGVIFGAADRVNLAQYIERDLGLRPSKLFLDDLVLAAAHRTWYNPVKVYLEALEWDGVPRLEECLPGVRPTDYTRLVARKALVAAVARVYDPGVKWDHSLVLYGPEGLGKTFWIERMALGYSNTLGSITQKDTLLAMQRTWIMVSDEGHSLRKSDADATKEFLTRREDVFRMPYDREAMLHKRHCVIWSTTNDETFLRKQEGNRRYLIVRCEDKVDFTALTEDYIAQVWAEARHYYLEGEQLFLADDEGKHAAAQREQFTEEDAMVGIVSEHLDTLVPDDWYKMSPDTRRQWMVDASSGFARGTVQQQRVCSVQLWVECLGNERGRYRKTDLLELTSALKDLPGWRQVPGRHRIPGYGSQTVFERINDDDNGDD